MPVRLRDIVRYRNAAGPGSTGSRKKRPFLSPGPAILRDEQLGNSPATHRGAPPDVARNRNVPDRLHGIDSSPANSRRARKGGKKVDDDTGTRMATLC